MQCENCGYIFFQPSKKCTCCSAPYVPSQSSFDVGQENLFTIFEMAPGEGGIPGGMGMAGAAAGVDDYNFTDDFDAGGAEYGVDENVLDLSDAEAEGFGPGPVSEPREDEFEFDTSVMDDLPPRSSAATDDFELNLDEDFEDADTAVVEPEPDVGNSMEMDFTGGFDEVEGLGFGEEGTSATDETDEEAAEEISLDAAPEEATAEPEISLEPELELAEDEPSLDVADEPALDIDDEQPSIELSEESSMELPEEVAVDSDEFNMVEEEPSMDLPDDLNLPDDLELSEEPELMEPTAEDEYGVDVEDDGGIDFDLDNVDLDTPEEITYVEDPEETASGGEEEPFMDLEGLEMETPEEPEDDDLKQ